MQRWLIAAAVVAVLIAAGVCLRLMLPPDPPAFIACSAQGAKGGGPQQKIAACSTFIASGDKTARLEIALRIRGGAYHFAGDKTRALQDLNHALQLAPDDAIAFRVRGLVYYELGQYDPGLRDFDQAIRLNPSDAAAYNDRGLVFTATHQIDKAIADYGRAIGIDGTNARTFANRGFAYLAKGEFNVAIPDFNNAVRVDPKLAYAYSGRGLAYVQEKASDKASADFGQAISLSPDDAASELGGRVIVPPGRVDKVFQDLNQAILLAPDAGWAYLDRGQIYLNRGEFTQSIADFDQAAKLRPTDAAALNAACWARGVADTDLQTAMDDCNKALTLDPKLFDALDSRAFVNFRLGRWDDAVTGYTAALAINSELPSSLYVRGIAEARLGDAGASQNDIEAAKAADANVVTEYASYGVNP